MKIRSLITMACCLLSLQLFGVQVSQLHKALSSSMPPFDYPLNIHVYPSKNPDAGVIVCLHGCGGDYTTGAVISQCVDEHVVSFNFPDAGIAYLSPDLTFGTINEILPALYVLKQCLAAPNVKAINLYGFSAGGGALVNVLAVLNRGDYEAELTSVGIMQSDKQAILEAIQKGYVIIDCPLKSIDEIITNRGNPTLVALANNYAANRLRPIDSLNDLQGLSLTVLLNFQDPDNAVLNRDDRLYADRLRSANRTGRTYVIVSHDEGHVAYHPELWKAYRQMKREFSL